MAKLLPGLYLADRGMLSLPSAVRHESLYSHESCYLGLQ